MASKTTTEKVLTFDFLVPASKVIKFEEEVNNYQVSDAVAKLNVEKFKIVKGTKVSVKFDENNVVQFVKKTEEKKEEPKAEAPTQAPDSDVYTVHGIPDNKKVIKFKEEMNKWYDISTKLQEEDLQGRGITARAKVRIKVEKIDGSDTIIEIVATGEKDEGTKSSPKKDTETKKDYGQAIYGGRNESIEKQSAFKSACEAVSRSMGGQVSLNEFDLLQSKIIELAKSGYQFIKNEK